MLEEEVLRWQRVFFRMEQTSMPGLLFIRVNDDDGHMMIIFRTKVIMMVMTNMMMLMITIITMKLNARTAWGNCPTI